MIVEPFFYVSEWFLWCFRVFVKNAILWTWFVTPRGDQTQQDQTKQVSYYKREESEESDNLKCYNLDCLSLVGLYTSV